MLRFLLGSTNSILQKCVLFRFFRANLNNFFFFHLYLFSFSERNAKLTPLFMSTKPSNISSCVCVTQYYSVFSKLCYFFHFAFHILCDTQPIFFFLSTINFCKISELVYSMCFCIFISRAHTQLNCCVLGQIYKINKKTHTANDKTNKSWTEN